MEKGQSLGMSELEITESQKGMLEKEVMWVLTQVAGFRSIYVNGRIIGMQDWVKVVVKEKHLSATNDLRESK